MVKLLVMLLKYFRGHSVHLRYSLKTSSYTKKEFIGKYCRPDANSVDLDQTTDKMPSDQGRTVGCTTVFLEA